MSGPIEERDLAEVDDAEPRVEIREGRSTTVGGMGIKRVLPTKGRRTVGPWCFVDLMLPPDAEDPDPMEVGPHPHIGLSTVTWLLQGEAIHSDSLGTQQPIRPGQLNLMTAGRGIAHAELATDTNLLGVQMWLAQPDGTRAGGNWFEHHGDLPGFELSAGEAVVFMGELAGVRSPARTESPVTGSELRLGVGRSDVPLDPMFEHCVAPVDAPVLVGGEVVEPGWLALIPAGSDVVPIESRARDTRAMLLGGAPMDTRIQMWWNFVARTRDELTEAWRDWQAHDEDRFGPVPSTLERIDAPPPPWIRTD